MFFKKKKDYFGTLVILIKESDRIDIYDIEAEDEGLVYYADGAIPLASCSEKFTVQGDRMLLVNMDIHARLEAEDIRNIRESVVLRGLFDYVEPKSISDYVPLVIMGVVTIVALFI